MKFVERSFKVRMAWPSESTMDGLLDYVDSFLTQHLGDLSRRPVLINNHLLYAPPKFRRLTVVALQTLSAGVGFCLGVAPYILSVGVAVALQLPVFQGKIRTFAPRLNVLT